MTGETLLIIICGVALLGTLLAAVGVEFAYKFLMYAGVVIFGGCAIALAITLLALFWE